MRFVFEHRLRHSKLKFRSVMMKYVGIGSAFFMLMCAFSGFAQASVIDVTLAGSDAIWLAGRTDLTIPPASDPWPGGLLRHGGPTPEEILETMPPGFAVSGADIIRVLDPATGGVSFFNGFGGTIYGPEGNGIPGSSSITSFGGISGYLGTQGALVGVFLTGAVPNGAAPATLDFSTAGLGTDFLTLSPAVGQVFYIGNGVTSASVFQQFVAPAGATRVFFGITDAFGFNGAPGAFDDNDGSYRIRVGINEVPTTTAVPEPATLTLLGLGMAGLRYVRKRR
jgi:hypothetical protein